MCRPGGTDWVGWVLNQNFRKSADQKYFGGFVLDSKTVPGVPALGGKNWFFESKAFD